jgi:hypothetical protein
MATPALSEKLLNFTNLGAGNDPTMERQISGTRSPDNRTTPMPPLPDAVACATIVSLLEYGSKPTEPAFLFAFYMLE